MNKSVISLILGACLSAPSFASNVFQFLESKQTVHHSHPAQGATIQSNEYTNFTGSWHGTCAGDDETDDLSFTISNDGFYFRIIGQEQVQDLYVMGDVTSKSTTANWGTVTEFETMDWSQNKTVLILKKQSITKMDDWPITTYVSKLALSMQNDKLILAWDSRSLADNELDGERHSICTLSKVE